MAVRTSLGRADFKVNFVGFQFHQRLADLHAVAFAFEPLTHRGFHHRFA
jgi:hypothetical protein